jgi:hypothetical protein
METKRGFKTIPIWVRAGMTWNVTPDELEVLLGGDDAAIGKMFAEAVRTGKAYPDGETYIPESVLDGENLRENLTSGELDELAEKSWDCYPER